MDGGLFYRFGKLIYTLRWFIIVISIVLLIIAIPVIPKVMDPFKSIGFVDPKSDSAKANIILNKQFGYGYHRFVIVYSSNELKATDPLFRSEVHKSLMNLDKFPIDHDIILPDVKTKTQISKDDHTAYVMVIFKNAEDIPDAQIAQFRSAIVKPKLLTMKMGGEPIFLDDTKKQTQIDLYKAEYIAAPVAIITMLIIFGTVIAAGLPIILGGIGALVILICLSFLAHLFDLSIFTINIALLLGLCLSLDYSLFIISRFREELKISQSISEAIAITFATAGKAIFFSGLAVFISLSALLLFPINVLFSVGMGGLTAVLVSVVIAIIVLPSILAILGIRINSLAIPFYNRIKKIHFWARLVTHVVRHRFISFFGILILLLLIGYPFLHVQFGISDFRILPTTMESRQVFDMFVKDFGEPSLDPIFVIVKTGKDKVITKSNISYLYDLVEQIKQNTKVDKVDSIVSVDANMDKKKYMLLYQQTQHLPDNLKKLLRLTTKDNLTVLTITSKYPHDSPETKALINELRAIKPAHDMTLRITGTTVNTIDVLHSISQVFPYALLWILVFSYLILLILLRSLILPLKAILMTILSLFASYGVLTFVIQDGHFHHLLDFQPQGMLDISLLIIIFCALFGVSMDYEVFLLTRIKESYEETGRNIKSILYGIDHSSKIITSAAIIVILLCIAFMTAKILLVKAFGLGIAVAVFIDAFLIRIIFVPATMAILKSWNWYLPGWLDKILPIVSFNPHKHSNTHDKR